MKLLIALILAGLQPYVLADTPAGAPTGPTAPTAPCSYCSTIVSPVCGTNGKTYRNSCFLQCNSLLSQANGKQPFYFFYYGPCFKEICACTTPYKPRCASDDKTYGNKCLFDCENDRRFALGLAALTVKYFGECIICSCTNVYDPLCASDKKTYKNPCLFDCENEKRLASGQKPLTVVKKGPCQCDCKNYYDPVCGSDDRDYANICLLQCESDKKVANGQNPIKLAYGGTCKCDCSKCPVAYSPVCGDNGKTYWNKCWLDTYSICNLLRQQPKITQVKPGYC